MSPELASPTPKLEDVAVRMNGPVVAGPPDLIPGLMPKQGQLLIVGETNVGKAQPLDAKVLTPDGWKLMGDIQVSDELASPDSSPSRVIAIHPRGKLQVYRITFADGRSTEACADHLWKCFHPNWERHFPDGYRLRTTQQILDLSPKMRKRVRIDAAGSLEFGHTEHLPIDPWLIGMLLGDGGLSTGVVSFTAAEPHIVERAARIVKENNLKLSPTFNRYGYNIIRLGGAHAKGHSGSLPNPLKEQLKTLGLMGCRSHEKFIPEIYMTANMAAREQLLTGLMDTDGYVSAPGGIIYTTTSKRLAEQVTYLVRSLGGTCTTRTKLPFYRDKNGNKVQCNLAYNLGIGLKDSKRIVSLPRKIERLKERTKYNALLFTSIEPSRIAEAQCITVSHPEGLYITDEFIVTHNSLTAIEMTSALVTGSPLWGQIRPTVRLKRVLYVLGEHYPEVIQRLYQKTLLPLTDEVLILGPEQLGFDKWIVAKGQPNLQAMAKFKKWAAGCDLIVFDPLAAFCTGVDTENDNITMRLVLDTMSLISQGSGASCLVLAHQGKPQMDQFGTEHSRKKYATRGASGIEDAATNIFYLNKADGMDIAQKASGGLMFDLIQRKYKGTSVDRFRLLRDPETLTHTLVTENPYQEVMRIDTQAKIAKLQAANPDFTYRTCLKLVADMEGIPEETLKRRIGLAR